MDQQTVVIPHIATDSTGNLRMVVCSSEVVGVCFEPVKTEALSQETFHRLLHVGTWATVLRVHENSYYTPSKGLMPKENDVPPGRKDPETVRIALEVGLATWPEWGNVFRGHLTPRNVVPIGFPSSAIEV